MSTIFGLGITIFFCFPVAVSISYLLLFLFRRKSNFTIGIRLLICIPLLLISFFLIFFIVAKFAVEGWELPPLINILGFIIFLLYHTCIFLTIHSLGTLGHAGISPANILTKLYNIIVKKE